jgi:hypothetical protein
LTHLQEIYTLDLSGWVGKTINACSVELVNDVLADVLLEVGEVVLGMEATHLVPGGLAGVVDVEVAVEAGVDD